MRRLKLMSIAQMVIFCIWILFSMACFLYFILEALLVPGQGLGLFAATKMTLHTYAGLLVSILMIINGLVFFRPTQYIEKNTFNRIRKAWCENKENHTLSATEFALKMVSTIASKKTLIYLCGWTKDNEQVDLFHKCLGNEAFLNEFFGTKDKLNYSDILIIKKSEIYKEEWSISADPHTEQAISTDNTPKKAEATQKYYDHKDSILPALIKFFDASNRDGQYRLYAMVEYFINNNLYSGEPTDIALFISNLYYNRNSESKRKGMSQKNYYNAKNAIEEKDKDALSIIGSIRQELEKYLPKID